MRYGETNSRALAARVHAARRLGMALLLGAVALTAAPAAAIATQGDVIVTNYRYVTRTDATGARTILSGFSNPGQDGDFNLGDTIGVAMAPNGDLFVADAGWFDSPTPSELPVSRFGDKGGIWRIDAKTGFRTPVSSNADPVTPAAQNFESPVGVAVEADGNLIVTDYGSNDRVFRVNPDTGDRTVLSNNASPSTDGIGFSSIEGLAIAPDGTIYVADSNAYDGGGGIFRVDPVTGERTMISNNDSPAVGTVPDYDNPSALAFDRNGDLLVADRMTQGDFFGSVIRVDPVTGERTLVSDNDTPDEDDDVDLVSPAGIAVAPDDSILVSRDPFSVDFVNGVERVDPVTGERTLFSSSFDEGGQDTLGPWGLAIDSTPIIQASFVSPNVPAAGPARLRLKVSGLRYALTGRDWSLASALPAGLAVAADPNATLACEDVAGAATVPSGINVDAAAGATEVDVTGQIKRGDAFCTIDVDVVAPGGPDTYVVGPATITAREGLDPPPAATSAVRFQAPPIVTIESPSNGQTVDQNSPLAASFGCIAPAGVQTCTATSANGASLDTSVPGTYAYTATVVDAVGQVATKTTRYTIKAPPATSNTPPPPPPPPPPPAHQPKSGAQLALECSGAKIALLEVIQVGNRVRFSGVTSKANAGRTVPISLLNGPRVVLARVQPNGLFEITGPLPKASIRETEKARYVAELGGERSASVKLTRRMTMDALNVTRTTVTIYGQIAKPLPKVRRDIVITQRTTCGGPAKVVATVRPNTLGNYRATIRRPPNVDSAIYRLRSRVRVDRPGQKETFRTYTLVRAVDLF
jgi:sugar lactone lactonase YvrE